MGYFEYDETTQHATDYQHFLLDFPSTFHTADFVRQRLEDAGFTPQNEKGPQDISPGGHVALRSGAAVTQVVPETLTEDAGFRIVGVHTGSPAFRVKPSISSTSPDGLKRIGVGVYGDILWSSWLDRKLVIARRLLVRNGSQVLVRTGALARIPQLAIHLDRTVNPEGLKLDPQQHLHLIWSFDSDADLMEETTKYAGVKAEDIVSHDLVLIPQQGPGTFGDRGQFSATGRQDNFSSVHPGLIALEHLTAKGMPKEGDVPAFIAFNHEEIGSETQSGAAGLFLASVLGHTGAALGRDLDARHRMLAQSSCVSAGAAHSVHPSYAEHHDPHNRPVMDRDLTVEVSMNRRYATDAEDIVLWLHAYEAAGVANQGFVSHNVMPCGSTIGPITMTGLGILTVDVGIGLLSMHSACEMSHVDDPIALSETLEAYWLDA